MSIEIDQSLKKQVIDDPYLIPKDKLGRVGPFADSKINQFVNSGFQSFNVLVKQTKLKPFSAVMDYGCGVGRIAMIMAKYLKEGHYLGIDVMKDVILDCRNRYSKNKNFEFQFLNMFNDAYNKGGLNASDAMNELRVKRKVDLIYNFSIFSHLLPEEIEPVLNFFKNSLKEDGEVFLTLYLRTENSLKFDGPQRKFHHKHPYKGAFVEEKNNPAYCISYTEDHIESYFDKVGFKIATKRYGLWSGTPNASTYQDFIVLKNK